MLTSKLQFLAIAATVLISSTVSLRAGNPLFAGTVTLTPSYFRVIVSAIESGLPTQLNTLKGGGWNCGGGCGNQVSYQSWNAGDATVASASLTANNGVLGLSTSVSMKLGVNSIQGSANHRECHWCGCFLCGSYCHHDFSCGASGVATASFAVTIDLPVLSTGTVVTPSGVTISDMNFGLDAGNCGGLCGCGETCRSAVLNALWSFIDSPPSYSVVVDTINAFLSLFGGVGSVAFSGGALVLVEGTTTSTPPLDAFPYQSVLAAPIFYTVTALGTDPIAASCQPADCPVPSLTIGAPVDQTLNLGPCAQCVVTVGNTTYFALLVGGTLTSGHN